MDDLTRKFTLEETRSSEGAIVDARGRTGTWPLRRATPRKAHPRNPPAKPARSGGSSCSSRKTATSASRMDVFGYRIVPESALAGNLQLHVLARAYRDAWLELKRQPPIGQHRLESLGVTIEFGLPENL